MGKKRVFIAIDGSNFYHKLKSKEIGLVHLSDFDYKKFALWLAKKNRISEYIYYIGQIREERGNKKSLILKRDQDRLLAYLRNQDFIVKTGYILKSDGSYHEKGVDVQIAVDICMKAVRNEYDCLVLVSSDTDLIPAIKEVRQQGKYVEYVGFDFNPSFAMIRFSNSRTLLKKEDLTPFAKKRKK
jgi:uncharacterized LabA/DUF88 family protein